MAGAHNGNPDGIAFWALVKEDFAAHHRDWTSLGFRAVFAHRFGNWAMGLESPVLRFPTTKLYWWMARYARSKYGIELQYGIKLGRRVVVEHQSGIVIHGLCEIGDDCRIRQNTTIGMKSLDDPEGVPVLGRDVDVGAGAVLCGRIRVGDGAFIGANAVVMHDVPAGALAVGVPARIVDRAARPA